MHLLLAAKLAWSNTTANWQRLFVRCSGVTFAVVLMFMQTGFRNALFDSNVRIMEQKIDADIVIRIRSRFMLSSGQQMPLQQVIVARSAEGVAAAEPLYIENMLSALRRGQNSSRKIRVLGFDPGHELFANFGLAELGSEFKRPGTAVSDVKSKSMFGLPTTMTQLRLNPFAELGGRRLELVGLFRMGINFSNDGTLAMTPENFARYFPVRGGLRRRQMRGKC
jgi:putative ABC transport system permease protein